MEKRMKEIAARKAELRALLDGENPDLDAIEKELGELETEERGIQRKMEIAGKLNSGELRGKPVPIAPAPAPEKREESDPHNTPEYRTAFMNYVLRGTPIPLELRAGDEITATTDVGSVIPTTVINTIVEKMEAAGMILPLITRTAFKGGVKIPTSAVKPTASWVSEGAGSDKQKKTTSYVDFGYFKLRCAVATTLEVDTMALSAFEAALIRNVVEAMTKALEQAIISGVGTASPKGILAETPVTGQALTGVPSWAKLVEAEGVLPLEYENGAVWCMTKKTFMSFIGEVDDLGQPLARINYGIAGKPERTLLGRPVVLCNYLDSYKSDLDSGKVWAFLFNFSDYALNTNYNMTIKKYEDNDTDDMVTKAIMLVDGKVVDKNSLVTLAMA
jgi:HK97 family phage major capsid protein